MQTLRSVARAGSSRMRDTNAHDSRRERPATMVFRWIDHTDRTKSTVSIGTKSFFSKKEECQGRCGRQHVGHTRSYDSICGVGFYQLCESHARRPTVTATWTWLSASPRRRACLSFATLLNGVDEPGTKGLWYHLCGSHCQARCGRVFCSLLL